MRVWLSLAFQPTDQLRTLAQVAEEVGLTGVGLGHHLIGPGHVTSAYPYSADGRVAWDPAAHTPDPLVTFAALSSVTSHLKFMTTVYLLPLVELLAATKAVATTAVLTGGRLRLGVGVGWAREEFDAARQDFRYRGRRLDEMLHVMGRLLEGGFVEHHGEFYDFPPLQAAAVPSPPVPILVGGESMAAMRRAARASGWISAGPHPTRRLLELVGQLETIRRDLGSDAQPFSIRVSPLEPPTIDLLRRLEDIGVTDVSVVAGQALGKRNAPLPERVDRLRTFAGGIRRS
jgi:probable F420-dependent oxidoreductase